MSSTPTRASPRLLIQIAIVAVALAALAWRAWPDGKLRVVFLDTKGDAALVQMPNGEYVLIDGGSDPSALTAALGRHMPFWRHTLDAVVLTNTDTAHLPGQVAALARYRAAIALAPPIAKRGAMLEEWRRLLAETRTPIHSAAPGEQISFGPVRLQVLAAGDGVAAGVMLRLDYGRTSVVFDQSGDATDEALAAGGAPAPVDLLVFPWERDPHTPIVAALRPRAMVLTDGQSADRPAELTFAERATGGAALYHERLDGTITWLSDGQRASVITEHPRG
jgi:beta-lactamase superfamily II metal-dependent hydrolase